MVNWFLEDGCVGEFDNVGFLLGMLCVYFERYLEVVNYVFDVVVVKSVMSFELRSIFVSYVGIFEVEWFVGKVWKCFEDGVIVCFSGGGYLIGMI